MVGRFLREHSLGVTLVGIYLAFQLAAAIARLMSGHPLDWEFLTDMFQGHADDSLGAILVVLLGKWFIERGRHPSPESR